MRTGLCALIILVGAAACGRKDSGNVPKPQGADPSTATRGSGSSGSTPLAADPWATAAISDDAVPTLSDRKKLADDACPTVTGPYFFRIEKAGKVSHILGTRHVVVPLSKFPETVHD